MIAGVRGMGTVGNLGRCSLCTVEFYVSLFINNVLLNLFKACIARYKMTG